MFAAVRGPGGDRGQQNASSLSENPLAEKVLAICRPQLAPCPHLLTAASAASLHMALCQERSRPPVTARLGIVDGGWQTLATPRRDPPRKERTTA